MRKTGKTLKNWIKYLWTPPVFEGDPEKTNIGKHLHVMTWFALAASTFYIIVLPIVAPQLTLRILLVIPLLILQVPILAWAHRGQVKRPRLFH